MLLLLLAPWLPGSVGRQLSARSGRKVLRSFHRSLNSQKRVYIYIYTYTYIYIHMHMYIRLSLSLSLSLSLCIYIYIYTYNYIQTWVLSLAKLRYRWRQSCSDAFKATHGSFPIEYIFV